MTFTWLSGKVETREENSMQSIETDASAVDKECNRMKYRTFSDVNIIYHIYYIFQWILALRYFT